MNERASEERGGQKRERERARYRKRDRDEPVPSATTIASGGSYRKSSRREREKGTDEPLV
jgi:hypothetical protein